MSHSFRCAVESLSRDESLAGTASTVRAFLLVECPGPWGADAIRENRLPEQVRSTLLERAGPAGVRPLLVRRHGRNDNDRMRVFAGYSGPGGPWLETTSLSDPDQLLDLDLTGVAAGRSAGLEPHPEPLFLVCTHGRHDVCCAELGRPVAAALSVRFPDQTWEVSHIGGDRFAGNVLVLPDGLYYGRVDPKAAVRLAERHLRDELDLDHLRGRSGYGFPVQAAEIFLRRELGIDVKDALRLRSSSRTGTTTEATFTNKNLAWTVTVQAGSAAPEQLTCRAMRANPAPTYTLVSIEPVKQPEV